MASQQQPDRFQEVQRIHTAVEGHPAARRLKISVESYDPGLGWYPAGSLSIPLHQVPLLEQALEAAREEPLEQTDNGSTKLVPFPGLRMPLEQVPPGQERAPEASF